MTSIVSCAEVSKKPALTTAAKVGAVNAMIAKPGLLVLCFLPTGAAKSSSACLIVAWPLFAPARGQEVGCICCKTAKAVLAQGYTANSLLQLCLQPLSTFAMSKTIVHGNDGNW